MNNCVRKLSRPVRMLLILAIASAVIGVFSAWCIVSDREEAQSHMLGCLTGIGTPEEIRHAVKEGGITQDGLAWILISWSKASSDNEYMVEKLVKSGANVNAKDEKGHTPLYYARSLKREHIVNLLRQAGAKG